MADKIKVIYETNLDQYNAELKKTTKATKGLDKATDEVDKSAKDAYDPKRPKKFATATDKATDSVKGLDKKTSGLSNNLGKVAGAAGAAFAIEGILNFLEEMSKASREALKVEKSLSRLQGVGSANLGEVTAQTRALANTFDESEIEISRAAQALSKGFGIDGVKALEFLEKGFLGSANANDDLIDSVKEYSVQAKAAGLTTNEFLQILNTSGEQGIFSDKGIDTVKEFGLRIREQTTATKDALENAFGKKFTDDLFLNIESGSITTADALRIVSKALDETTLTASQTQTVIADVFGGAGEDAGIDFIKSLKDIDGNVQNLAGSTSKLAEIQKLDLELTKRFNRIVGTETEGAFVNAQIAVKGLIIDTIDVASATLDAIFPQRALTRALKAEALAADAAAAANNRNREAHKQLATTLLDNRTSFKDLSAEAESLGLDIDAITESVGTLSKTDLAKATAQSSKANILLKDAIKEAREELEKANIATDAANKKSAERARVLAPQIQALRDQAEVFRASLVSEEEAILKSTQIRRRRIEESAAFRALEIQDADQAALILQQIEQKSADKINKIQEAKIKKQEQIEQADEKRLEAASERNLIAALDRLEIEAEGEFGKVKQIREDRLDFELENDELGFEERLLLRAQFDEDIAELEQQELDRAIAGEASRVELAATTVSSLQSIISNLQGLAAENTVFQKALFLFQQGLAIADVIISLQRELAALRAQSALLPPGASQAFLISQTAIARLRAFTSIAVIGATAVTQEFKDGVIDLEGEGTSTSDSINAKLSKGESVIKASRTKQYLDELYAIQDGTLSDLINNKYIKPALDAYEMQQHQMNQMMIGEAIAKGLKGNGIENRKLYKELNKKMGSPTDLSEYTIWALADAMTPTYSKRRGWH